ncbi:YqcC family protein [Shewanella sp. WXL01]|uniref:YqcC family protein n=1 Tax=Shewanella maritima TaxID=2520507 RepID=A0A411PDU9_9GAMM|nr:MULTISPECIES: YqcC family protein [Shewanella]NKF50233.1 YqcC family protein [Shewanella sp. WXL01]QBF81733.1 YqcC family protein [Shewanella maritima]
MSHQQVQQQLVELESLLKSQQLWSTQAPSAQALASSAPFACDTLALEQWLQFIFIPKMTALIEAGLPLPSNMAIAPMAEHVWDGITERKALIQFIAQLDALVGSPK